MRNEIQLVELFEQINHKLRKLLAPVFRKNELSITEVNVLMLMDRKKTSRMTELTTMLGIPASTLTGILDRLVLHGFLERGPDPDDRRGVLVTATPKLNKFMQSCTDSIGNMLKTAFESMSESRLNRLLQDLQFVLENLAQNDSKTE